MENLQQLPVAKVLFQSHGGGAINNNGYGTGQSSMRLLTERVTNGYYKTVVCLISASTCCHGNRTCVSL